MKLLFILFSRELDYALSWMVLHSLWQGTLIALLLSLVMVLYPRRRTRVRYMLANIFLFMVLCSSAITFIYEYQKAKERFNVVYIPATTVQDNKNIIPDTGAPHTGEVQKDASSSFGLTAASFNEYFNRHFPLIVMIWAFGVCLFVIRLLGGVSYIYYLKQRMNFSPTDHWLQVINRLSRNAGVQRSISLVESVMVRTPLVVGFFKPMILFPFGLLNRLTQEEAEAVLAHEIAHILRHDYLFNIIQSVIESLFYYHPAVWWISSIIRNERESACDEIAIRMTGSPVNYAKALVTIQELVYNPVSPALAFAGQDKSQFMYRIQRILNIQKYKRNYMGRIITILSMFILLAVLAVSQKVDKPEMPKIEEGTRLQENNMASGMSGIWEATIEGEKVCVTFSNGIKGSMWLGKECFDKADFSSLPAIEAAFTVTREAGTIYFKGKFTGNKGDGRYSFSVNESYRSFLEQQGITGISDETMLHAFLTNINRSMIGKLQSNGYRTITGDQFRRLAVHDVNENEMDGLLEYFSEQNYAPGNVDKITEMKIHDVNAAYINGIKALGFGKTKADELLRAKIHGVQPGYINALINTGYDNLTMKEIIELKINDINADYINELNKVVGEKLPVAQIVDARIHGVDPATTVKVKQETGGGTAFEEIKTLTIHGVDADYSEAMNKAGFGTLTNEQLLSAKIQGIDADYMKSIRAFDIDNLAFENVMKFKIHAIDADYIAGLKESGITISVANILKLKIQDVTPAYIQSFKPVYDSNLSANEALELRKNNVTVSFIEDFRKLGFTEIPPAKAARLKMYDVTPEYVKYLESRGITPSGIDKVIEYRKKGF